MLLRLTARNRETEESDMIPITLKRSPVIISAIAVFAIMAVEITPAATQPIVASVHGLHEFLSAQQHSTEPGLPSVLFIAIVLFLAGVVSGLAGFAFSAIAACVLWLLSACNQLLSISKLHQEMTIWSNAEREGALPYIIGGLGGVPIGVALLRALPSEMFAAGLGGFLIAYSVFMLLMPDTLRITVSGWRAATAVGALGGIVGGFSGFGASILVVYLGLRGSGKSATRGITQPYILTMQFASLGVLVVSDATIFNIFFWFLWAITLPAVLLGSGTGVALYRRLSDGNFRRAVLILLILSGASLLLKTVI
jgi:uncharacterized membrane protein YfcA